MVVLRQEIRDDRARLQQQSSYIHTYVCTSGFFGDTTQPQETRTQPQGREKISQYKNQKQSTQKNRAHTINTSDSAGWSKDNTDSACEVRASVYVDTQGVY